MTKFTMGDFTTPAEQRVAWRKLARSEAQDAQIQAEIAYENLLAESRRERLEKEHLEASLLVSSAVDSSGCNLGEATTEFMTQLVMELKRAWFPQPSFEEEFRPKQKSRGR